MHRALVLGGAIVAGLLAAIPALAPAALGHRAGAEVEREVTFDLRAEGFTVLLDTTANDGEVTATLIVSKAHHVAYYTAPAKVTADTVKARFGRLGELDYRYTPKKGGTAGCEGEGEADFEGTFTCTGENGYVHIDAADAEGVFQAYAPSGCGQGRRLRRVVPYSPSYSDRGATLAAAAGSRHGRTVRTVSAFDGGRRGRHEVSMFFGGGPVELAGPEFRAYLHKGVPQDE